MTTANVESAGLVRALRRRDLVGILVNAMIGSGMMAAPAKVFALAHGWSFAVLAASVVLITPLILCFAELGSRFIGTGGAYLYARATLPPWVAFSVAWLTWISGCFSGAALTNLLMTYAASFAPALAQPGVRIAATIGFGAVMTLCALVGIRFSAWLSNMLAAPKLLFLAAFVVLGLFLVHPSRLVAPTVTPQPGEFAKALLIYIYAYTGFERAGLLAGEAREPRKDVPWALFVSLGIATAAYAGVLLVCLGALDNPGLNDRPLAEVGLRAFGPAGALAVSIGAITVILGVVLVGMIALPRMLLALAEQGQLPAALGAIHPRWRTPHIATLLSGVAAFSVAAFGDLLTSVTFSTISRLVAYMLCCYALWRLSRRADAPLAQFELPAPGVFAAISIVLVIGVIALGAARELPTMVAILAVGLALYGWSRIRYRKAEPPAAPLG